MWSASSPALRLTDVEREHLFLLAQHRPPEVRHRSGRAVDGVSPPLPRVLDALGGSPEYVKTATWDVVARNAAAAAALTDYGALEPTSATCCASSSATPACARRCPTGSGTHGSRSKRSAPT